MSKKEQELALKQEQTLAMQAEMEKEMAGWGQETDVSSNDLVIEKLWLMQALSDLVAEKELFKAGDIVSSVSETKVAGTDSVVKAVPFKMEKVWYIMKDNGDKGELVEIIPVTKENENLPYEFDIDGDYYKRVYVIKIYAMIEGQEMPVIIDFKSTSLRTGKVIATECWIKNKMAGKAPGARYINLSSEKQKNDKGVFYTFKATVSGDVPMEEQYNAFKWFKTLQTTDYVEGDSEPSTSNTGNAEY